ncbi:MAG: hypothetical protein WA655_18660 [Candidatus Korobacteraceae bacterium]
MEIKHGYKQTEVGIIPEEWETRPCSELSDRITVGIVIRPTQYYVRHGIPALRSANIREDGINDSDLVFISAKANAMLAKSQTRTGDVLTVRTGYPGTSAVVRPSHAGCNCIDILITTPSASVDSEFLAIWINSPFGKEQVLRNQGGLAQKHFNVGDMRNLVVALPRPPEQRAIATASSDLYALLDALERLIAKKRDLKQAAMQQLLTGRTRLPGFIGEWEVKRIAEIGVPQSERNVAAQALPVLTCSKHRGFVDSIGFFKNQVFSKDLSTYKLIRRGEIGYPANHVEEGSIGLQELYDVALVSPIYIVFRVAENINSYFLHRLLKLDSYRQK